MLLTVPAEYTAAFLKSANTPNLKSGCEPKLLYAGAILAFLCGLWLMNLWGIPLAVFVFIFTRALARRMANEDPYFTSILADALRYEKYYPARPLQAMMIRKRTQC